MSGDQITRKGVIELAWTVPWRYGVISVEEGLVDDPEGCDGIVRCRILQARGEIAGVFGGRLGQESVPVSQVAMPGDQHR